MNIKLSIATFAFSSSILLAQQDPQFTQNMFNRLPVNPGFAGTSDAICANLLGRSQWMGFEGAPRTFVLGVDAPIRSINSGIGLTIMSDQIGFEDNVHAKVAYSYHLPIGAGKLGIGLDLGMMNKSLGQGLNPLQQGDPSVPLTGTSATVFDAGFGLYYASPTIFGGISATHLPQSTFTLESNAISAKVQSVRHLYMMAGYNYDINPQLQLRPFLFVKNSPGSTQIDLNAQIVYDNKYWGGLTYRLQDAFALMVGMFIMKDLRFGLSYDVTTSRLSNYSNGSVELFLGYCFNIAVDKPVQRYRNVRNL
jgi:type IX secretion system PorP/SprF family membrane protein